MTVGAVLSVANNPWPAVAALIGRGGSKQGFVEGQKAEDELPESVLIAMLLIMLVVTGIAMYMASTCSGDPVLHIVLASAAPAQYIIGRLMLPCRRAKQNLS
jgi:hypothetical protein